ncbi:MAG: DUF971 domain-containing protein [Deltaproteobacteria bacterium]|nr:DUF971 domain-containing protein [Deltaproteobacteria bacterium]
MQPTSIKRENNYIHIEWSDGHKSIYEINYLRRRCPCVVCRNASERSLDGGVQLPAPKISLQLLHAEKVGHYAIQLSFNDGHDAGIYSFDHLRKICPCSACAPS